MSNALNTAVSANIAFAKAQVALIDATTKADDRFRASALAFVNAKDSGVSDRELARAVKDGSEGIDARLRPFTYTSPTSVGYHYRTGLVLALEGGVVAKSGDIVLGFQVQTAVKVAIETLKVKAVDELIAKAETAQQAYDSIVSATKSAVEEAKQADEDTTDTESDEVEETEGDLDKVEQYLLLALDQLTNARNAIAGGADLSEASKGALGSIAGLVNAFAVSV